MSLANMKRAEGTQDVALIECINPHKGTWRIRLDITETENGATWMEHDFDHKPTGDEIRSLFVEMVNEEVQQRILTGFTYDGDPVWLSTENQLNFRSAPNMPVRFKLGEDNHGNPVYRNFTSQNSLTAFNKAIANYIAECLNDGWTRKDAFNVQPYLSE